MKLRSSVPGRFYLFVLHSIVLFALLGWAPTAHAQSPSDLRVTPSIVGPDSVAVGDTAWYTVKLENVGSIGINILQNFLVSADPDFAYYPLEGDNTLIDTGSSRTVRIRFTPVLGGIRLARLRILSDIITWGINGPDTASYIVDIKGVGVPYGLMAVTCDASFDSVLVGSEICHTFEIANKGQRPLVIESAAITGIAANDFVIRGLTYPLTIEPRSKAIGQLCATPAARGLRKAEMEIVGRSGDRMTKSKIPMQVYGLITCAESDQTTLFEDALVRLTSSTMRTIAVTNCGDITADYYASVKGDGYKLLVWDFPIDSVAQKSVRPGEVTMFEVEFRPGKMSVHDGLLTIRSAGVPEMTVLLRGTGGSAILKASNTSVTTEGEPVDLDVTVTNTGNYDWSVGMPAVAGGEFTLKSNPAKIVANGGTGVFSFTFTPVVGGSHQAQVTFPNSDNTTFNFSLHGSIATSGVLPVSMNGYELWPNYPNPASRSSTLTWVMPEAGPAKIVITDLTGETVAIAADGIFEAGLHSLTFDASTLSSGSYFVELTAGATRLRRAISIQR